jgi:dTDP-4-dehydrorhamnose reductase
MNVIITGATSKSAEAITRILFAETDWNIFLLSSDPNFKKISYRIKTYTADYFDLNKIKKIFYEIKPEVIINCAAYTDVDGCEDNRKLAIDLNSIFVENLVSISRVIDAHLIIFSSDYIFDGLKGPYDEEAKPNPLSYYGKTKHSAENVCRVGLDKHTIIRTNVVFGVSSYKKANFIDWIIDKYKDEKPFNVITGQYCNPTLTDDIGQAVLKIILKKRYGVYNVAGKTWMNRFEIAKRVAKVFNYDDSLVTPVESSTFIQKAKRPEKGGLIVLKAETDLNVNFADLDSALFSYKFQINDNQKFYSSFVNN